ncbi:unnamed protein product [Phytomonas sp. Hart1]|nr:unnamed protein product [Phytomonas sp. Hart1]|eukprot:CCW69538.1 unnamed protein product [Phytomonas sp. isolate Hart1]
MSLPYPNRLQYRLQPSETKIAECMVPNLLKFATTSAGETPLCNDSESDLMISYRNRINHALTVIRDSGVPLAMPPKFRHEAVLKRVEGAESCEIELKDSTEMCQGGKYVPARMLDIFHAACDGDCKMIELNLHAGININAIGQPNPTAYDGVQFEKRWTYYATPLIFAAAFGRENAVSYLLKQGADVRILSSTCLTAKEIAAHRGYEAVVGMLEGAE